MGIPWKWNGSRGGWRSSGDLSSPSPSTADEGREGENLGLYSEAVTFPPTVVGMEWRVVPQEARPCVGRWSWKAQGGSWRGHIGYLAVGSFYFKMARSEGRRAGKRMLLKSCNLLNSDLGTVAWDQALCLFSSFGVTDWARGQIGPMAASVLISETSSKVTCMYLAPGSIEHSMWW